MRISDLIRQAEAARKEFGDMEIFCYGAEQTKCSTCKSRYEINHGGFLSSTHRSGYSRRGKRVFYLRYYYEKEVNCHE